MKYILIFLFISTMQLTSAQTVPNDVLKTQIYTLDNGLKVYMTVNKTEPKIQTYVAVKAGSKYDPSETTGLAHYLEHLMFKGTPHLGTINWEKEKPLLAQISQLYEDHKNAKTQEEKTKIYKKIDSVSYEASKYAIPNEYDKTVTSLGAQGTNAYTSNDQTVYVNEIPSNELEKWMMLESERFQYLVMRLFHTELETVYEEYNISQDNDKRWAYENLMKGIFPNHPYGTQTTIGRGSDLKNPSMVNIQNYFDMYYVPNNMAICLSGDFDPDKTMELIKKYFGGWKNKSVKPFNMPVLNPIDKPVVMENFGPQEEFLYVGYRIPAANSPEAIKAEIMDLIMTNGTAGILDLDLVQKQKILAGSSFTNMLHDGGIFTLYGKPKKGQTLEEVKDLLVAEVEKVKKGQFEDWLLEATINDYELQLVKNYESNGARAHAFVESFTEDIPWEQYAGKVAAMRKLTKKDIVDYANKYFHNNYVVSYKRQGENKNEKVIKPQITPVVLNRDTSSPFYKKIMATPSPDVKPVYVDFQKEITKKTTDNGLEFSSVKNIENNIAKLSIILPFGSDHDKNLRLMSGYLKYLGTDKLTSEQFQIEMYKNGLELSSQISRDKTIITISGLEQNIQKGIDLMTAKLNTCTVNQEAWGNLINDILMQRQNSISDQNKVQGNLTYYMRYGAENPSNTDYSNEELKKIKAEDVIKTIHNLLNFSHSYFYYGTASSIVLQKINEVNKGKTKFNPAPKLIKKFELASSDQERVYFYNYPKMVQSRILFFNNEGAFNKEDLPFIYLFNDFFGSGLSSIVFQELREQKALAYSAYSYYATPAIKGENDFLQCFIGTQADKMPTAVSEFRKLLNTNPNVEIQFNNSKQSALIQIASSRITRDGIYWTYIKNQELGFDNDIRSYIYDGIQKMTLPTFGQSFQKNIMNRKFITAILGDKDKLDFKAIQSSGPLKEITKEELFRY